jgi:hypothetical protein
LPRRSDRRPKPDTFALLYVRRSEIIDRDHRLRALQIGHSPLTQLHVLGGEHEHKPTGYDQELPFLNRNANEVVVLRYRSYFGIARQIDLIGQQVSQGSLRQWIQILRCQITIAHNERVAIRDELDRARRLVLKSHSAGLLEIELSYRPATVWTDLHEIAGEAPQGGEIIAGSIHEGALRSIVRNRFGWTYGNRTPGGVSWQWRLRTSRLVAALRGRARDRNALGRS